MGIVKKQSPRIDRQLGASNLHTDVPVRINKLSLAYPTHVACLDIPETNSSVKKTGAIKSIMRRSLPGGGGSSPCRKRLPSPHWRHKYSLPITVSNSMTDPELPVKLLCRSSSFVSIPPSDSDVSQMTRQSRSKRRHSVQADDLRRKCLKVETNKEYMFDKTYTGLSLSSTCPNLPLPILVEPLEKDQPGNEEKHPLNKVWEKDLSYHRFGDDLDDGDVSYFSFHEDLYAGVDLDIPSHNENVVIAFQMTV